MVRELIPREATAPIAKVASRADYRVLAAQCFFERPAKERRRDRPHLRPRLHFACADRRPIPANANTPQRVRFNVDIDVRRLDHVPEDMRDVLSYDVVTDGIG